MTTGHRLFLSGIPMFQHCCLSSYALPCALRTPSCRLVQCGRALWRAPGHQAIAWRSVSDTEKSRRSKHSAPAFMQASTHSAGGVFEERVPGIASGWGCSWLVTGALVAHVLRTLDRGPSCQVMRYHEILIPPNKQQVLLCFFLFYK